MDLFINDFKEFKKMVLAYAKKLWLYHCP
jgi:hypothetical protein